MYKSKEERPTLKYITIVDTVTEWFRVMEYYEKSVITITDLVEYTRLTRYPWPIEITHNQGS